VIHVSSKVPSGRILVLLRDPGQKNDTTNLGRRKKNREMELQVGVYCSSGKMSPRRQRGLPKKRKRQCREEIWLRGIRSEPPAHTDSVHRYAKRRDCGFPKSYPLEERRRENHGPLHYLFPRGGPRVTCSAGTMQIRTIAAKKKRNRKKCRRIVEVPGRCRIRRRRAPAARSPVKAETSCAINAGEGRGARSRAQGDHSRTAIRGYVIFVRRTASA